MALKFIVRFKGSAKSGNYAHGGRPGKVGGSSPKPGAATGGGAAPAVPDGWRGDLKDRIVRTEPITDDDRWKTKIGETTYNIRQLPDGKFEVKKYTTINYGSQAGTGSTQTWTESSLDKAVASTGSVGTAPTAKQQPANDIKQQQRALQKKLDGLYNQAAYASGNVQARINREIKATRRELDKLKGQ